MEGASGFHLNIGTAPVNWNNFDLHDWRPEVAFPAILDEMQVAGYRATEWDASFGADLSTVQMEISKRDMSYTGAYRWIDFLHPEAFTRDLADLQPFLTTLAGIGALHLIVSDQKRPERIACAGAVPADGSLSLDEAGYATIASSLAELASAVAPLGINVHYHNHVGSYIETPAEVAALTRHLQSGPVDVCFDTGHFAYGGGDSLAFLQDHIESIGYLHLKDVNGEVLARAKAQGWSFLDALREVIFCPLGEGQANIPAIVRLLVERQFPGWVIVEQDTCDGDSTITAGQNLTTLRKLSAS